MRRVRFKHKRKVERRGKWKGRGTERRKENWMSLSLVSVTQWWSISRVCWGPGFDSWLGHLQFFLFLPKLHFQFPFLLFLRFRLSFAAFFALFEEAEQPIPEKFNSFWHSLITLFRATLGLTDIELGEAARTGTEGWVVIYTVAFLIISYILLVNLVITMMQQTQGRLSEEQDLIWKKQVGLVLGSGLCELEALVLFPVLNAGI